eukprot:g8800.t1
MDGYLWYIAQVDRLNPDNQVSPAEAELMVRAGKIAKKVGGSILDLGSGSGNDFPTIQAGQFMVAVRFALILNTPLMSVILPVLAVEPNRFTWAKAEAQAQELKLSVSFAANLEEATNARKR